MWATLNGAQLMYAVRLDATQTTHCPSQPVVSTVLAPAQNTAPIPTRRTAQAGSSGVVRTGSLIVGGGDSEVKYVSLE